MAESPAETQLSPQQTPQSPQNSASTASLANLQTVAQARAELEARLAGIHNDLQLTQTIGLLFVKRQEDLKACFDQLQLLDGQEKQQGSQDDKVNTGTDGGPLRVVAAQPLPESFREQLAALDKEFQEGQSGIAGLKDLIDAQLVLESTSSDNGLSHPRSVSSPNAFPSSTLPAQTISKPRRHKVVMSSAPSVNDAAFPLQIQEELLNQVRYWTSQAEMKEKLNQEYDTKINEQERIIDALNKQRRLREESEERQKEDQWNLELQNQELRNQNADLQAQLSKMTHENAKIQKKFAAVNEQVEQLKDKEEKTASQLELVKTRHEQDMASMRKHVTGIQREKSELLTKVEDLNNTMTQQQQQLTKKSTLEAIARAQDQAGHDSNDDDLAEAPLLIQAPARLPGSDDSAAGAKGLSVTEPKVASLARETSFAHQQSIISELQTKLSQEITAKEELISLKEELLVEKEELIKMLADREETIETMRLEGDVLEHPSPSKGSSHALFDHPGSRPSSGLGLLDDADAHDRRDLSMALSDNDSQDYSTGRGSPFPTGGLFAELAQATSHSSEKAPVEYKDQEAMTEPIESWIHTLPEVATLLKQASASQTSAAVDTKAPADEIRAEVPAVETITGKPGTETKQITTLDAIDGEVLTTVGGLAVAAAVDTDAVATSIHEAQDDSQVDALDEDKNDAQDVAQGAVAAPTISEGSIGASEEGQDTDEHEAGEPVPRATKSEIEEERRHTCDLSQSLVDTSVASVPPVPAIPVDLAPERPSLDDVDRETRVSFGSAFGGNGNATDTGRIQSIYKEKSDISAELPNSEDSAQAHDALAPTSVGQESTSGSLPVAEQLQTRDVDQAQDKVQDAKEASLPTSVHLAGTAVTTATVVAGAASALNAAHKSGPTLIPKDTSITQQSGTIESAHQDPQVSQGPSDQKDQQAATTTSTPRPVIAPTTVVSVSSHTTYTFDKSSSQVLLPQLRSDPQYEQLIITDSPGAAMGRANLADNIGGSPNCSMSSLSTDYNHGGRYHNGRRMSIGSNYDMTPTDPTMIQIITQTMIGDYLWKYTRRRMANMMSEKRHRRYVWVHPYTKTIYWSQYNPGAEGTREQRAKSALILAVAQISDDSHSGQNSDLPGVSLLVQTTSRNLKLTAPTREKHELWFQSISYLLSRPSSPGADIPSDNQTWSEVQANNGFHNNTNNNNNNLSGPYLRHKRSLSLGFSPNKDAALSLRQGGEKGPINTVRKKGSLARLQGMFGRNSVSREGAASPTKVATAVGSPRIGSSGLASATSVSASGLLHPAVVTTSAAAGVGNGNGHGHGHGHGPSLEKINVVTYPGHSGKGTTIGGVGIVNGGSILAQAEAEQALAASSGVKPTVA
ncbi:hypothetical protein KVV02_007836 [Mortierella alpina]|uniref:PH domain-containing protein n=1 Tax=Mortierella alpina TaxID=64518 RepID=A0A9P8CYV8_MORAP|nr:hypothetical protein KVV02_007836 [Mortierella alpina]